MLSIRWLAIGATVSSLSAGIAIAASQSAETTTVTGDFQVGVVSQEQRECDAGHVQFRVRFEGTQTSSDPRLSGMLVVRATSVVNTQNGYGYTRGQVRVSDPASGELRFQGLVIGVLEPDGGGEGLLAGRTAGPKSVRLIANFSLQQNQTTGTITGEFGKDSLSGASKDPAILTNACKRHGRGRP